MRQGIVNVTCIHECMCAAAAAKRKTMRKIGHVHSVWCTNYTRKILGNILPNISVRWFYIAWNVHTILENGKTGNSESQVLDVTIA